MKRIVSLLLAMSLLAGAYAFAAPAALSPAAEPAAEAAAAAGETAEDTSAVATRQVIGIAILSESGHYMLPVRAVFEIQGADVSWNGVTKSVTLSYGDELIGIFTVGSSMLSDGTSDLMDLGEPCINVNGTVYFCGDAFLGSGLNVDPDTLEIYIPIIVPTSEAYVTSLTETGSGFVRHPEARDFIQTVPINLSARASYTRWIWMDTGEADVRWLDAKKYLTEDEQAVLAQCAPNITFTTDTVFPDNMPDDYDPAAILEAGKNPGLGVRALHEQGITGAGVSIAILDQVLYTDHPEYADKLALYEEIHIAPNEGSSMHGGALTSIAVGETTGVAPGAKLYYWAFNLSRSLTERSDGSDANYAFGEALAVAVDRVLEVNSTLPENEKIRVIAIAKGFGDLENEGVQAFLAAIERAKEAGIFVITTSTNIYYDWLDDKNDLAGLGKLDFAGDADDLSNYTLGTWQQNYPERYTSKLLVPMDARTTADFTTGDGYVFYTEGGWSWTVPYLAGVYALACQVDPDITPERFWALALETASSATAQIRSVQDVANGADGTDYTLEHVINPAALLDALKK